MNGGTMNLPRIARITTERREYDGFAWIAVTFLTVDGTTFSVDAHPAAGQPLPAVEHLGRRRTQDDIAALYSLYQGEKAAGLLRPQSEINEELRQAGRGHLVKP